MVEAEVDLDRPLLGAGSFHQWYLIAKRLPLNDKFAMVGEQTEGLTGLHLLSQFHLEFLHLKSSRRVGSVRDEDGDLADKVALGSTVDCFGGEAAIEQLQAIRFGRDLQTGDLIVDLD